MTYDPTQSIAPALNPGDKVGYFDVGNPLAAGGMSLVWKGFDKLLNRHVAIKQIASTSGGGAPADETMRERFRKEAELQKRVSSSHKNLVQIIDFIEDPRGLFIVMEYVDGSSLDTVLAKLEGPMDPKQALGIIHQIAVSLVAVHGAGILHRDLKPSNILLPREGGVKICDFGLAAVADEQDALTLGTARYMAPELFTGQPSDARADLYSLGMIAYEMLAGRPVFEETFKTVMRDQRNQALRWMKWHTNMRLLAPPLDKLNSHVPPELSELIARLMAKDVSQRIPTASALIEVMKRLFTGQRPQPTGPAPQAEAKRSAASGSLSGGAEPTAPLPKKSRLPLILAAVLGVQLLLLGAWFGYRSYHQSRIAADAHRIGMEQFKQGENLYKAEKYADAEQIFRGLADQWPGDAQLGAPSRSRALVCEAKLLLAKGDEFNKAFQFGQAAETFTRARDVLDKAESTGGINLNDVKKLREEAQSSESFSSPAQSVLDLIAAGDFNSARMKVRLLKETQTRRSDTEDKLLTELAARIEDQADRAQVDLVLAQAKQLEADGQLDKALQVLTDAQAHFNTSELRDRVRTLNLEIDYQKTMTAARAAEDAGDLAKAIGLYRKASNARPSRELADAMTSMRSRLAFAEGRDLERQGRLKDAEKKYVESDSILPNDAAKTALKDLGRTVDRQSYVQTADAAMAAGDYATAINLYQNAMKLGPDTATQGKLNQAVIRQKTGEAQAAMNRWDLDKAGSLLDESLQLDPTDAQTNRAKAELNVRMSYRGLMAKGDAARSRSLFGEAGTAYRAARDKLKGTSISTDEITQRINDTEFDSWIAKARASIEARQWTEARAFLKSAQHMRDNQTVRDLLSEVDRNDPDNAK